MFTDFDGWAAPTGAGLCPPCAWAYATPELRLRPHLIVRDPPGLRALTLDELGGLLRSGPIQSGWSLLVPLRPGRKHLAPLATWGRIRVDSASLHWSTADVCRLQSVTRLRAQGFGSRMLAQEAAPYSVLRRLPAASWAAVLRDWERLSPWRAPDSPWLALALHATRGDGR